MKNNSKQIENQSRRDFFIKMALAGLATSLSPMLLGSCEKEIKYQGTGKVPFKVWEEMLQAIKTSPDYLPQRVADLVASKDPEAMYNFVKNEIILIPATKNGVSYYNLGKGIRWGIKGVLRCGMATPREKVELLNDMYRKAGFESKVVYELTNINREDVPRFFYRPVDRVFEPKVNTKNIKKWQEELGIENIKTLEENNSNDYIPKAKKLSDKILKTIDADKYGEEFDFIWDNDETPTVEFIVNGEKKYAHLFNPDTLFGEKHSNGRIVDEEEVEIINEKVKIKISYRLDDDYKNEKELISGEWNMPDLIGNQIQISFLNGLSLEEQTKTKIGALRTFIPSLALTAPNEETSFMQKRSFIGNPITIDGKRIELSNKNGVTIDGFPLLEKIHPKLQEEVTELHVTSKTINYPMVKLSVFAKDNNQKMVEGLASKDFTITEDGNPVRAIMENNQRMPKILILSDNSLSMPKAYLEENMEAFNIVLKEKITELYPAAKITFWKTPSALFTWLLKASIIDCDLIIYATDGDNDDSFEEKNLPIYQRGAPALILNVYNSETGYVLDTFNKMAEITNGKVFNAEDQELVIQEVSQLIEALEIPPYVFSYASADKTKRHQVKVSIDKNRLNSTANYTFPTTIPEKKPGVVRIDFEMKIGAMEPVKRILAGWDDYFSPKAKDIDDVFEFFLGGATLFFEGEGPTLSAALVDILQAKLSHRNWGEAYLENNITKAKEELEKGILFLPSLLEPMMAPLQAPVTEQSLTFPAGFRTAILKFKIGLNGKNSTLSFDYLPTSHYSTVANDKETRFVTTLEKTAQLAVREGAIFKVSTYNNLFNKDFSNQYEVGSLYKEKYNYKDKMYHKWYRNLGGEIYFTKIYDKSFTTLSHWKIDNYSGEMYGILPDGTGGGENSIPTQLNELLTVVKMYTAIIAQIGIIGSMGGFSLSVVAQYGKTLYQLFAIVSEVIMLMDASGMDAKIKKALGQLACNVLKEITFATTGGAGAIAGQADDLIGILISDEQNPFSC